MKQFSHVFPKRFPPRRMQQLTHESGLRAYLLDFQKVVDGYAGGVFAVPHFDAHESRLADRGFQVSWIGEPFLPGEGVAQPATEVLLAGEGCSGRLPQISRIALARPPRTESQPASRP